MSGGTRLNAQNTLLSTVSPPHILDNSSGIFSHPPPLDSPPLASPNPLTRTAIAAAAIAAVAAILVITIWQQLYYRDDSCRKSAPAIVTNHPSLFQRNGKIGRISQKGRVFLSVWVGLSEEIYGTVRVSQEHYSMPMGRCE